MPYLLDANVFIEAKKNWYGMDFCPGFWEWLVGAHRDGVAFSVQHVADELAAVGDELADWAANRAPGFFLPADPAVLAALARVGVWANTQGYHHFAVTTFLQGADGYLVAHALAHGHTVVTHERPAMTPKNVKIPNACAGVGVKCITTFDLLRRERARFLLGPKA